MLSRIIVLFLIIFFDNLNAQKVQIYTASKNGNYYKHVKNSHCVYDLFPIVTTGSLENIKNITHQQDVAYAMVQGDVLAFVLKIDRQAKEKLLFKKRLTHYDERIYLLRNIKDKNFKNLTILNKEYIKNPSAKPISVGLLGSGSSVTGYNILTDLKLGGYILYSDLEESLDALLNQDIFAILYVSKDSPDNWVYNTLEKYGEYIELMEIKVSSPLYKNVYKNKKQVLTISTYLISNESNNTKNEVVYQCLDQ